MINQTNIERTVLKNGIVVITTENMVADIVSAKIFLGIGSRYEAKNQSGISHLLAAVLTKGTEKLSSLEIAQKIESVGARLGSDTTTDYFLLSIKTVSEDFDNIFQLSGEIIRYPSFPETEIELEKRITIQSIRSQLEQPFTVAFYQLREMMYQNHPYALSTLGTENTVSQITSNDIQKFHKTYFRPDNIVISIVGKISHAKAITLVEQTYGDWQPPITTLPTLKLPTITPQPFTAKKNQETQQSIIMLGYLAAKVNSSDYAPLKLLNTYLGNGLSSRLFVELREKRGLAYDVSAFYPTRLYTSNFTVYIGTAGENTAIAEAGLKAEIERLVTNLLSEEELQICKNKLLGQYALGKQTNSQIAQLLGWYEILNLGIDFDAKFQKNLANVTTEEIQKVASKYFIKPYISIVGQEK
ncbi:MAG: insulinase family protein [Okeania sp. SIO3I5]|uniref:M16 family metallopeptidase n=1 Tax=Okeania sp. SIO3I5 TaxID=2607805 RepID=UPI0013BC6738|nr:pitrilysin family protein [Okeania sp. SIO3I5]NEQ39316.1 insulinase family protein [Okeania sp. SIO3I5]